MEESVALMTCTLGIVYEDACLIVYPVFYVIPHRRGITV